ncbi:hypothetical protein [Parabacteroides sp.]
MRETMVKYIKWLLPVLFIAYYSSILLFTHVHVEDGTTIVHAHPFKKAADGTSHQHGSLAEIQLFHVLSSIHVMDGAIHSLRLQFYSLEIADLSESPAYPDHVASVEGMRYLRAPPVV